MVRIALFLVCALFTAPAFAQSYVAAAVGLDVSRSTEVESRGSGDLTAGGEATAFSLRVGTAIRERWGVELDFTRPSEIEREVQQGFPVPLLTGQSGVAAGAIRPGIAIPVFQSRMRLERRNVTLDTVAWVAQDINDRVELVYLGGVAFSRVVQNLEFEFTGRPGVIGIIAPSSTRTTIYGVGPVVGADARIDLTEHVILVPGVRLHGLGGDAGGGWLLRSSVGLGWRF